MKKKIAILGSTGSVGKTTFNIVHKDKQNFEISILIYSVAFAINGNIDKFIEGSIFRAKN